MFIREIPSFKTWIKESTVTFLVTLYVLYYITILWLSDGAINFGPTAESLSFSVIDIINGEFWRLQTWIFIQMSFVDYLLGLFWLILLSTALERTIGKYRFLVLLSLNTFLISTTFYLFEIIFPSDYYYFGLGVPNLSIIGSFLYIITIKKSWLDEIDRKRVLGVALVFLILTLVQTNEGFGNLYALYGITLVVSFINSSICFPNDNLVDASSDTSVDEDPLPEAFEENLIAFCPYCAARIDKYTEVCTECGNTIPNSLRNDSKKSSYLNRDDWLYTVLMVVMSFIFLPMIYIIMAFVRYLDLAPKSKTFAAISTIIVVLSSIASMIIANSIVF